MRLVRPILRGFAAIQAGSRARSEFVRGNSAGTAGRWRRMREHKWGRKRRWFVVAFGFTALGLGLLKWFVEGLHWSYAFSTFVQSETCNLLRFVVNDRWVFGYPRPTWKRLGQHHVANALSFLIWWAGANGLKAAGMNYLLASLVAILGSFGVSWLTNFYWIWRKRRRQPAKPEPRRHAAGRAR